MTCWPGLRHCTPKTATRRLSSPSPLHDYAAPFQFFFQRVADVETLTRYSHGQQIADLKGVKFNKAILKGANLLHAKTVETDLRDADLTGVDGTDVLESSAPILSKLRLSIRTA